VTLQFLDDLFQPLGARPLGKQHRLQCQIASNRDPRFASNNAPSGVMGLGLST
jgi:hypothetical protein